MSTITDRLKADTHSERIALFLCTTEGDQGESGCAVNERDEWFSWWLNPDDSLEIYDRGRVEDLEAHMLDDPEYLAARAEVLPSSQARQSSGSGLA